MKKNSLLKDRLDLNETFKQSYKERLSRLLEAAPSDSTLLANIKKTETGFLGKLQITSPQETFFVESERMQFDEIAKSLLEKMHNQIRQWKANRFHELQ